MSKKITITVEGDLALAVLEECFDKRSDLITESEFYERGSVDPDIEARVAEAQEVQRELYDKVHALIKLGEGSATVTADGTRPSQEDLKAMYESLTPNVAKRALDESIKDACEKHGVSEYEALLGIHAQGVEIRQAMDGEVLPKGLIDNLQQGFDLVDERLRAHPEFKPSDIGDSPHNEKISEEILDEIEGRSTVVPFTGRRDN